MLSWVETFLGLMGSSMQHGPDGRRHDESGQPSRIGGGRVEVTTGGEGCAGPSGSYLELAAHLSALSSGTWLQEELVFAAHLFGVVEWDVVTRRSSCGRLHIVWSITYRAFSCRRGGGCMQEGGRWCKAAGVAGCIEAPACAHHMQRWDPVRFRLLWYPVSVSFSFREEREEIWLMWVSCGPPGEQDDVSATL